MLLIKYHINKNYY